MQMLTTSLVVAALLVALVVFLRARAQAKRLRTRVKDNIRKRDVFRVWVKQVSVRSGPGGWWASASAAAKTAAPPPLPALFRLH